MRDCLRPHRNLAAETQLKTMIQRIQSLMYQPENHSTVEKMLEDASKLVKAPNRVLDLEMIEHYESWTDLDGLVGELTMEVPVLSDICREDLQEIVQEMRGVIESGQAPDPISLDYWMDFYREFFALNFPSAEDELYEAVFEDIELDEVVEMALSHIQ